MSLKQLEKWFFLGAILLSVTGQANGELYRWVDENGKVHFSDRVDAEQSGEVDQIRHSDSPAAEFSVDASNVPIVRPFDALARKVYIGEVVYGWKLSTMERDRFHVGNFHVDKSCMSRGKIVLPDAYIDYSSFFPDENDLSGTIRRVFQGLDYEASTALNNDLIPKLRKSGALGLRAEITAINLKACDKYRSSSERKIPANQLPARSYDTSAAELEVNWVLLNSSGEKVFSVSTAGSSGTWQKRSPRSSMTEAMESAARQLMARKEFVSLLMVEQRGPALAQSASGQRVIPPNFNGHSFREVGLSIEARNWATRYGQNGQLGELAYGGECNTTSPLRWLEAGNYYPDFLPNEKTASAQLASAIREAGYPAKDVQSMPWPQRQSSTQFLLRATVSKMVVTACAPKRDANASFLRPGQVSAREFSRFLVNLSVDWQLVDRDSGDVVFGLTTEGAAGDLVLSNKQGAVTSDAWISAAAALFSSPEFVEKISLMPALPQAAEPFPQAGSEPMPGLRPDTAPVKGLLLVEDDFDLFQAFGSDQSIGGIYADSTCQITKGLLLGQSRAPKSSKLSVYVHAFLNQLDYKPRLSNAVAYQKQQRDYGYQLLRANISDVRFDICHPGMTRQEVLSGRTMSRPRHRVAMSINWVMYGADGTTEIYRGRTQGVADAWHTESSINDVFSGAIQEALKAVLNDGAFQAALQADTEEPGFFDDWFGGASDIGELFSVGAYQARSSLLQTISVMKTTAAEYYLVEGEWPLSLRQLGIDEADIVSSPHIESVSLDGFGEIRLNLGGDTFDAGDVILVRGSHNSHGVSFQCLSNHQALTSDYCESL